MAERTLDDVVLSRIGTGSTEARVSYLAEATLQEPRLAGKTLRAVAKAIPREVVARSIDINVTNLSKLYSRKHLTRVQSEDISDLTALWQEMNEVFMGDGETLREWLADPLPALNGRAPKELMQTLPGRKALREILDSLRQGDFA